MTYRTDFRQKITSNYSRTLGSKLAKQAVRLGVPVANIAYATNLSRQTIYNWFKTGSVAERYHDRATKLLQLLTDAKDLDDALRQLKKFST
jgi:hypothetical protein